MKSEVSLAIVNQRQKEIESLSSRIAALENGGGGGGADGITPHIGSNGNWYIGTTDTGKPSRGQQGADGVQGPQGEQGPQGAAGSKGDKGADGYTPVKGVDYFTEDDVSEIAAAVLEMVDDGDEVSY